MSNWKTAVVAVSLSLVGHGVFGMAVVNTETWDTGANGWGASHNWTWHATGGVGDSGHMDAYRTGSTARADIKGLVTLNPSGGVFHGDVDARYAGGVPEGDVLISFHYRNLSTQSPINTTTPRVTFFDSTNEYGASTTRWGQDFISADPVVTGEWTYFETLVNTNWTDVEAQAAGWTSAAGTASWADVLQSVSSIRIAPNGNLASSGESHFGLDQLTFAGLEPGYIPEPASALLLLMATATVARRRRG